MIIKKRTKKIKNPATWDSNYSFQQMSNHTGDTIGNIVNKWWLLYK